MKRIKSIFILSLFVIFLFTTTKSIAQLLKSSNYFGDSPGYNSTYFYSPYLTEILSNTNLNSYIWNYNLQSFPWSSSTTLPLLRYSSYYNYPFNFWYDELYNHSNQSLVNINASKNQKEQSIDQSSEEIGPDPKNDVIHFHELEIFTISKAKEIITEDDNGKTFTFHVGDEFGVNFPIDTWQGPWQSSYEERWLEKEEIKPENGYGFENISGLQLSGAAGVNYYQYRAIHPGENELVFNCYVAVMHTEGPNAFCYTVDYNDIRGTLKITIRIID